jgi:hypothetical protein
VGGGDREPDGLKTNQGFSAIIELHATEQILALLISKRDRKRAKGKAA